MTLQLSIDKENVIREQQLNNQQLKKDFSVYTYEKSVLSEELIYLRQKALYENDITHLEKLERNHHHFLSEKRIIEQNLLKTKRTLEATNIHYLERTESVDMTNEMMIKDLEVIHSRIHHLFNQVYLIYNIHHHFMLSLIQIYEIPAHPEDVKLYIQTYLEVFSHLNTLQEYAKDQFLVDLNQFQEIKINDLSALKLKTDIDLLESEYITKIKNIDEEIQTNQQQIQQIEDRILILSSNVDRVQFDLNAIDDKDTHKTTSSNKKQLEKQLNGIETDIALLDKTVETHNRQIAMLSTRKNRLENELSKKRQRTTIKNEREATSYRKQKSFYIHSVKQITQLFKTYEDKVMILTKKIDQPIYLTDNIIKEYQKGYLRVEDFFEKSSNQLYQSLLKGSVKLFDQLIKQQNTSKDDFLSEQKTLLKKLDKEQMSLENKFKSIESEYKQHIKFLNDEKDVIIKNIQSAQFKTQEQDIFYKQKLLQSTESKILATETNLNKETVLIDDNLNSVVDQMKADFDKQILKLNQGHDKTIAKHVEQLESKFKELKSLEESTQLKNNQLSIKFTQTENKLFEANKQKLTNFEQSIHKKHALLLKKIQSFANELKSAQDKKDSLIINNEKKLSKFIIKIENYEKDLLIKELKDVRQSYAFKQRTLRL